eukprot:303832-Pyramimonas_sp.AAC.1
MPPPLQCLGARDWGLESEEDPQQEDDGESSGGDDRQFGESGTEGAGGAAMGAGEPADPAPPGGAATGAGCPADPAPLAAQGASASQLLLETAPEAQGRLWHALAASRSHGTPPKYRVDSKAFRLDPEASLSVGKSFEEWTVKFEPFFCTRLEIHPSDQKKYRGR